MLGMAHPKHFAADVGREWLANRRFLNIQLLRIEQ